MVFRLYDIDMHTLGYQASIRSQFGQRGIASKFVKDCIHYLIKRLNRTRC